jgi:hypothetical protein
VAVREIIDEFLAHGTTRRILALVKENFSVPMFNLIFVKGESTEETLALPIFAHTGGALGRLFTSKDPWRLKRCSECGQYFFDATPHGTSLHDTDARLADILPEQLTCRLQRREACKLPGRSYGSSLIPSRLFQEVYAAWYHELWQHYGNRPSQAILASDLGISERTLRRYLTRGHLTWPPV